MPLRAMALMSFMCLLWGGNMVSIKVSSRGLPPIVAATLRDAVASMCLFVYARLKGEKLFFDRADFKHSAMLGGIFGINFLLLYWGTAYTDASRAIIFLYTQPLWIALGAHLLLPAERLTLSKASGLSVAFLGLVMVFGSHSPELASGHWLGDFMELGAALFWAASILYIKKFLTYRRVSQFQTLFVQLFFSIPILAISALIFERGQPVALTSLVLANFFYQSVLIAFVTYVLYLWMVHTYPVSRLASFSFLTPIMGVISGAAILGEGITAILVAGLVCVLGGISMVNRPT